jgi:hypothetical protein
MADSTAHARGVVMQLHSQDDDLLFCRAVLAFFSHASFGFKLRQGTTRVPILELLQQAQTTATSWPSTRNLSLSGSQIRVDKDYVPVRE